MQLDHSFTVAAGVEQAWQILTDLGQIAAHVPGAKITSAAPDLVVGSLKVKLGPLNLNYKGSVTFAERDDAAHRAVIAADGADARNGTATAAMTARLTGTGDTTTVALTTDLELTGKPAQFGANIMEEVGIRLVGQFADNLANALASAVATVGGDPVAAAPAVEPTVKAVPVVDPEIEPIVATGPAAEPAGAPPSERPEPLSDEARPVIAKRLAPVALALVFGAIAVRRRRSS